ncbi:MAG: iron ABC transporter permease [Chryseolinea sp.]
MKWTINKRLILLGFILFLSFILNLSLGSVHIPLTSVIEILIGKSTSNDAWNNIIWHFRMTKALTCILAGSALSLAGLLMQTLFRNALAGPDVLGLSSGASLAVSLIFLGSSAGFSIGVLSAWSVVSAASLGCAFVFALVMWVARKLRDDTALLIVGLMIGATASSIVSVLQYLSNADDQQAFMIWTFGSLGGLNWTEILILAVILVAGVTTSISQLKSLNGWLLGDLYAGSLGIKVKLARSVMIFCACILTGAVTAFCGPIAFVGLAVPHLCRMIFKTHDHKLLIPAVVVGGSTLLLLCDIIAQLPGNDYVLPINAITALIGAPVVISIILQRKRIAI